MYATALTRVCEPLLCGLTEANPRVVVDLSSVELEAAGSNVLVTFVLPGGPLPWLILQYQGTPR